MTKFSEIAHHHLGTNLKATYTDTFSETVVGILDGVDTRYQRVHVDGCITDDCKPHFRSLSKLTQPIRVEGGEPFVPIDELEALFELDHQHYWDPAQGMEGTSLTAENILEEPFFIVQQLLDWGFNCFGLPEGEFIEIED